MQITRDGIDTGRGLGNPATWGEHVADQEYDAAPTP